MSNENHEFSPEEITPEERTAAQLTAYALGQLQSEERAEVERRLAASGAEAHNHKIEQIEVFASAVSTARMSEPLPKSDSELRDRLKKSLKTEPEKVEVAKRTSVRALVWLCVGSAACVLLAALMLPAVQSSREAARRMQSSNEIKQIEADFDSLGELVRGSIQGQTWNERGYAEVRDPMSAAGQAADAGLPYSGRFQRSVHEGELQLREKVRGNVAQSLETLGDRAGGGQLGGQGNPLNPHDGGADIILSKRSAEGTVFSDDDRSRLARRVQDEGQGRSVDKPGDFAADNAPGGVSQFRKDAFSHEKALAQRALAADEKRLSDSIVYDSNAAQWAKLSARRQKYEAIDLGKEPPGTEQYEPIIENAFLPPVQQQALSTFSIDVDMASYANMRRFLTSRRLPPRNSVRIEELVNYFRYEYPQPKGNEPFSVNMEVAECPWRAGHLLLRVGLKGKEVQRSERPASNLVFLLDVSGSMSDENKLPLLKTAMKMLAGELGENDRVSIVTYAGDAGLKLKSTRGDQQQPITRAIDSLSAGGSTNGSAGIELAYEQATANFIRGGTNRVILCTDGDLNVGITSDEALTKLIKQKAKSGVFLTVLGFGEGNLKDAKMEKLADNGNGLYAYIDSVREARKVLVEQLTGSTITIAKDVKIQVEFNPAQIAAYRLLGYENRVMAAQDFNNDKKDAGEIGAGHTVTALYELVPAGAAERVEPARADVDELKYQKSEVSGGRQPTEVAQSGELLTLKLRYKEPEGETSKLLEYPLKDRGHSFHSASPDLQFAAAVVSFGMILRNSQHRGSTTLEGVAEIASAALGKDEGGYRAEFVDLVRKAQALGAR